MIVLTLEPTKPPYSNFDFCGKSSYTYHMKQRKDETKEDFNKRASTYMMDRYWKAMAWLQEYKLEQGCVDCGYNEHHAGLEIDHVTPRNGDGNKKISRMAVRGIEILKRELADCDVVCGTCHNIRTWQRKQLNTGPSSSEGEQRTFNARVEMAEFSGGT